MGAKELREGPLGTPSTVAAADIIVRLTLEQLFDSLAIRIDGPRAWGERIVLNWTVDSERYAMRLENAVLSYLPDKQDPEADASITIARSAFNRVLLGEATPQDLLASGDLQIDGDAMKLATLLGLLDEPDPNFAIVTP
jgi:alkyl sulfatase BDS1-like metallo-beta-lactamase superfamily hydrolase